MQEPVVGTFRLHSEGLDRVLGSIEAEVMDFVWLAEQAVPIRAIQQALAAKRPLSFNTVVSVVNHLVDKGLLNRHKARRGHVFDAAVGREAFLSWVSRQVAAGLIRDFGELAVSQFVAVLREQDPQALDRLAAFVERARSKDAEN